MAIGLWYIAARLGTAHALVPEVAYFLVPEIAHFLVPEIALYLGALSNI